MKQLTLSLMIIILTFLSLGCQKKKDDNKNQQLLLLAILNEQQQNVKGACVSTLTTSQIVDGVLLPAGFSFCIYEIAKKDCVPDSSSTVVFHAGKSCPSVGYSNCASSTYNNQPVLICF